MKLAKLFEVQGVLDERIESEHPTHAGEDRLAKKILALQVELGECANEWRGFKFWSTNQEPSKINHTTQGATTENAVFYQCGYIDDCGKRFYKNDERLNDLFGKNNEDCPICEVGFLYAFRTKNPLLEEYVDCLHFILSIGIEYDININLIELQLQDFSKWETVEKQFSYIFHLAGYLPYISEEVVIESHYVNLFVDFIGLGEMLGFTWEQIVEAYYLKNSINHERQNSGY
jgi:dimeric dUTPase (all-alpha-NTP-PPase superfamily)